MSVIEALAAGRPAVATRVGGVPDVVTDGVDGYLVEPGDIQSAADRLELLAADPVLRQRMGSAGRERAVRRYRVPRLVEDVDLPLSRAPRREGEVRGYSRVSGAVTREHVRSAPAQTRGCRGAAVVGALIVLSVVLGVVAPGLVASTIRGVFAQATPAHVLALAAAVAAVALVRAALTSRHRPAVPPGRITSSAGKLGKRLAAQIDAVPWPLAVGLVAVAAGVGWYALARAAAVPRIFADELDLRDTARGFAEEGTLLYRGYGLVTPAIDAVAYLLTGSDVDAYRLIQLMNVVLMVSAAVPAYLLARRALSHRLALAVAALSVVVPWMVYSRFVMTEAAFYPAFLLFVLALVRTLEHSSIGRQLVLALALLIAFETRTQAVALAAAIASAVVVFGLARGDLGSLLRAFTPTWILGTCAGVSALALAAAGIWQPLGAYHVLLKDTWHPHGLLLWVAANVTSLSLGLGVLVVVAAPLGAAALLRRGATQGEQAFAAAAVSSTLWLLLTVAVLSVSPYGQGIPHERSLFFVAPLVIACALAWAARGFPRPRLLTATTALGLIALAILMPAGVISTHSIDDLSFALWATIPRGGLSAAAVMVAGVVVGVIVVVRLRTTWPLIASVALATLGVAAASDYRSEQDRSLTPRYAWVDRSLPAGARATILWVGVDERHCPAGTAESRLGKLAVYTEYFNSRVGSVGYLLADNRDRGLTSDHFRIRPDGVVTLAEDPLSPDYAIVDARVGIAGSRVALLEAGDVGLTEARRGSALALWRVHKPLRLLDPGRALAASAACAAFPCDRRLAGLISTPARRLIVSGPPASLVVDQDPARSGRPDA